MQLPTPRPQLDENVALVRFAALLFGYTGDREHRALAEEAMRYVASPAMLAARGVAVAGPLLAARELATEPIHVTVIGAADAPATRALLAIARSGPDAYRVIERWDPASGERAPGGVAFPSLPTPAAFLCAAGRCSLPLSTPAALRARLALVSAR